MSNDDIECPYCEAWQEYDSEQSSPDTAYETQCPECEKNFIFYVDWSPDFTSHKADCLNGEPHDWRDLLGDDEYMRERYEMRRRCKDCYKTEYKLKAVVKD